MNNSATAVEEAAQPEPESGNLRQPIYFKSAGFSIPPIDAEAALRMLDSVSESVPQEQRETFEHLKSELASQSAQPNVYGAPLPPFDPQAAIAVLESFYEGDEEEQRETFEVLEKMEREKQRLRRLAIPGFFFEPIDVDEAFRLLDQLDEFDPAEQRETFAHLRQALNAEREAGGERLLFP